MNTVDKESPGFLFFCGSSLCFDAISLFNAARPNSDSRLNGVGGRYLHVQSLSIREFFCIHGDPLADKFFLSLFSPCVYCK